MAERIDRIEAWLRMRDTARFNRDAKSAAKSVEGIGDEGQKTDKKLALLEKRAKKTKTAWEALDFSAIKVKGRIAAIGALALVTSVPLIELAGSASQAALGFGLLGATAGGAAAIGLGGLALVTKQALGGVDKIRTAQQAYNLALQEHGKWSDEAVKAQKKLNDVIAINGGKSVLKLLNSWDQLKKSFKQGTAGARKSVFGIMFDSISAARKLLPTFTRETNKNAGAMRQALGPVLTLLSGSEMRKNIRSLSQTFRGMIGPGLQGGADILITLLRYMRAAGPYVVRAAEGFAVWARSLRSASSDSGKVNGQVSRLVSQLRSWWGLVVAIGRLMIDLFSRSASGGQNLIDKLTAVVWQVDAWVKGLNSSSFDRWNSMFIDMAKAVGMIVVIIGKLVDAALPGLESGAGGVQVVLGLFLLRLQVLTDVIKFLGPLTGPLIIAFVGLKVATLAWAAATTLLGIALRLTPLGWIVTGIALVIAAVILMYNHFKWFRDGVNAIWSSIKWASSAVWNFIKSHWELIPGILLGPFGMIGGLIVKNFDVIKTAFKDAINWVITKWNNFHVGMGAIKIAGHTVVPGFDLGTPDIPLLATGGVMGPGDTGIVGDAGPEVASVDRSGKTTITPLSRGRSGAALDGVIHVHSTIITQVDKREIGRATADQVADWKARKGQ